MPIPEGRDVFQLQPLLYPALPADPSINSASPAALGKSLRCAEPFGPHLFLGSSDGQVHCFTQPSLDEVGGSSSTSSTDLQHVGSRHISSKPIEKIVILARIGIAAVLSEATLTFFELPQFTPIPPQVLPHTKGVASVVLDDEQIEDGWKRRTGRGGVDEEGLCNLCIVKRKSITLVKISADTWRTIKEIPLPSGATVARRFGAALCYSTTAEYNMVNLEEATMSGIGLPITQTGDTPSAANRPSILSIVSASSHQQSSSHCEFVITSHSQDSTLGVFVSQTGEPTARLLEFPSHPRALALEYPYLHALLRNDSIEVHHLPTMQRIQTLHLPESLEPRTLSLATSTLELTEGLVERTARVRVRLSKAGRQVVEDKSGSSREVPAQRRSKSRVLVIGKNMVQCLNTNKPLVTARKAVRRGDYRRAKEIIEGEWQGGERSRMSEEDVEELEYLDQMVAMHCLQMLQFEEAQKHIIRGRLTPHAVLQLFPSLYTATASEDATEVEVYAEVEEHLAGIANLEAFPLVNLRMNYTPPLDVDDSDVLKALTDKLVARIRKLLHDLLDEYRRDSRLTGDRDTRRFLDTFLARTMISEKRREDLNAFLQQENQCDMQAIATDLASMGCFNAELEWRKSQQDYTASLDLFTRLLDGDVRDESFQGTIADFIDLLQQCPEPEVVHKYSLWLVQRDAEAGVALLTRDKSSSLRDQQTLLLQLRRIDERAADGYLEYMALSRKQHTPEAHMELAQVLVDRLLQALERDEERKLMQQITTDYIEGGFAESFVAHMALYCSQTPTILLRLKLIMLLQGSSLLDCQKVLQQIRNDSLLLFEQAILAGRLARDEEALDLFAIRLRDANSAEIYCNQNRFALSYIQLQSLAQEQKELVLYANFYAKSVKKATRTDKVKLLKVLLRVYMEKGADGGFQVATSHLLNSQSLSLSAFEVLEMVPSHWSLSALETFLSRSLRKEMHRSNDGQIERNIALAQNLEVAETLWAQRRSLGGVIEDGEGGGGGGVEYEGGQDEHQQHHHPIEIDLLDGQEKIADEKAAPEIILSEV